MYSKMILGIAAMIAAGSAQAGDAEAGKKLFEQRCRACHMIQADDGTPIQKGGKTGPNLYEVIGRTAGSEEGYRYKDSVVEAGQKGLVWDEASFTAYVQDPSAFLKEYLGDGGARSGMTFKLRKGAEDVYAYLASVGE
ncbi:c-type cytochrome [Alloyangia pacifica]|uniref:Cytochrome c n=1 Tax=Alloyangia pacifica TaxID=311180 RepID=A0A1I6U118_9RHOB|nr:c-type cytochrome [Alloyangia pacifica]SDH33250.1 cytochrome c [Alloyangia pacifica]SFS95176.1 cytochrome c [Alloyangia pacifica]